MKIEIQNLKKVYGNQTALDIESLTINPGEIVGLVGNNGAGKTTLLSLMLDIIRADNGNVRFNNMVVSETQKWKELTGSYIDSSFVIPFYTPEEFFEFVAQLYGIDRDEYKARLSNYSALMNDEILGKGKQIQAFSEGNKQKIGIIAAMFIEPQVLLLDEPFNYLDPTSQVEMARMLVDLNKRVGTTIIASSHNLESVVEVSSRIILLEKGLIKKDIHDVDASARRELDEYFIKNAE